MKHMKITNPRIRYLTMFLFLLLTELFIGICMIVLYAPMPEMSSLSF